MNSYSHSYSRPSAGEPVSIPLENGGFAVVDEEDAHRVEDRKWYKYQSESGTWYAYANEPRRKGTVTRVFMHRVIFGLTDEDSIRVDHKNHDGLDNRRSSNIRLATPLQNATNRRKRSDKKSSEFTGVFFKQNGRSVSQWVGKIAVTIGGLQKQIFLGHYPTEVEAVVAYQTAATLLKDPEFIHLQAIPADGMPTEERQREIKKAVVTRIKAKLSGHTGPPGKSSNYIGVCFISSGRRQKRWRSGIRIEKRFIVLGTFAHEIEAAYAYDCGVLASGCTSRRTNRIQVPDLPEPSLADVIKATAELSLWQKTRV